MGKTTRLEGSTLEWAHDRFREYYRSAAIAAPERTPRREFAAFPFTTEALMRRHASFREADDLRSFLAREAPRHVYYSSAYYRDPDHPKMDGKGWLGADLIFDLDADHLRQAEGKSYAEQLVLVRERLKALYDDFLLGDFGVDPATARIVFSGGRGYHVHVQDERFQRLNSPERRELVEYILGVGFDPLSAIVESREADRSALSLDAGSEEPTARGSAGAGRPLKRLAPPETPGWRGRTTRSVVALLARWDRIGADGAATELESLGVSRARARALATTLVTKGRGRSIREGLTVEVFPKEVPKEFLEVVLRQAAVEVQGETDAPVTTDIHRLIRLPTSLHGGTGFRAVPLTRETLDDFDPFRDALVPDGGTVTVELTDPVEYPFPDRVHGQPQERPELPAAVGLFLILRGEAVLPPSPG